MQKLFYQETDNKNEEAVFSKFSFGKTFDRPSVNRSLQEERLLNNSFFKTMPRIGEQQRRPYDKTEKYSPYSPPGSKNDNDDAMPDATIPSEQPTAQDKNELQNNNADVIKNDIATPTDTNIGEEKAAAYKQGYDDCRQEFEQPIAEQQTLLLQRIADDLANICENQSLLKDDYQSLLTEILNVTLCEVLPVAISSQFHKKLKDEVMRHVPSVENFSHIHVAYHPDNHEDIISLKDELLVNHPEFENKISFDIANHLASGEVEFQQGKGGIHFNSQEYAKNIQNLAVQYFKNAFIEDKIPSPMNDENMDVKADIGEETVLENLPTQDEAYLEQDITPPSPAPSMTEEAMQKIAMMDETIEMNTETENNNDDNNNISD